MSSLRAFGVVGVEPELPLCPALAQQVPAAVERDLDLLQPGVVAGLELAVALALEQVLLFGNELVDLAQNLAVIHACAPRRDLWVRV